MLDFEKGICAYKYCAVNIIYMQNLEDEKYFSLPAMACQTGYEVNGDGLQQGC